MPVLRVAAVSTALVAVLLVGRPGAQSTQRLGCPLGESQKVNDALRCVDSAVVSEDSSGTVLFPTPVVRLVAPLIDRGGAVFNAKDPQYAGGAKCDAVTDDTVAIQKAIDTACLANQATGSGQVILPPGTCVLTSTLLVKQKAGCVIQGMGSTGQIDATILKWNGSNSGTVVRFDQTRDSELNNLAIQPGSGTIGTGLDIDQVAPVTLTSTNNHFSRLHIGASTSAVVVSNTAIAGNDLHEFRGLYVDGVGTAGLKINNSQAKFIKIIGGALGQRTFGIQHVAGSFQSWGTNFFSNGTDIQLGSPTDTITITGCQSENAGRFLDEPNTNNSGWAVTVTGCRLDTTALNVDGNYIRYRAAGPFNLIGNDIGTGSLQTALKMTFDNNPLPPGAAVVSMGNKYGNVNIFTATDVATVTSVNDVCTNALGVSSLCRFSQSPVLTSIAGGTLTAGIATAGMFSSATASAATTGFVNAAHPDKLCWKNFSGTADVCLLMQTGSDNWTFQGGLTLGSGAQFVTQGATGDVTVGGSLNVSSHVGAGIAPALQHKRAAGCTTAATVGATCASTLTWTTPANVTTYTATCTCEGATNIPVLQVSAKALASVTVTTIAASAAAASCTTIDCMEMTD